MDTYIYLLITMLFSAFFSGMEIAFVSVDKLRFEMEREDGLSSRILAYFFRNSNNFISTMLVGNNIALVIYGILMAQIINAYLLRGLISNDFIEVLVQTIISTLIILVTGEFSAQDFVQDQSQPCTEGMRFPADDLLRHPLSGVATLFRFVLPLSASLRDENQQRGIRESFRKGGFGLFCPVQYRQCRR